MHTDKMYAIHHLWIDLESIREEPSYKQFVRLRLYEKVHSLVSLTKPTGLYLNVKGEFDEDGGTVYQVHEG
jgi:hypothetical protein